jgi:predicted Rossmann fold flavoprotein
VNDVLVIGAGAAGLATAIFAGRAAPGARIRCLDGARHIGAKILVSGGSRCNVTNRRVTERDYWGGSSRVVRHVLRAFPAARAAAFFADLGVTLHEEAHGKLFPDSNSSRTVLEALLAEASRVGVQVAPAHRVVGVRPDGGHGFMVEVQGLPAERARVIVLATGGRSLPKTGSDGFGYELAGRLGHGCVPTTPALAPLVLGGARHTPLSGVSHEAELVLWVDGKVSRRVRGDLLWTHVGVSGPVALDFSRHWHRARLARASMAVTLAVCPGESFATLERWWLDQERARPRARVTRVLGERVPSAVAEAWAADAGLDAGMTMAHTPREARRRLVGALLETPIEVRDSRGYAYAEVTAGGVPLDEIDPATMGSRVCPGLYLAGEVLDVDGRLGGFNFQWSWSSGWVAGHAIAARLRTVSDTGAGTGA